MAEQLCISCGSPNPEGAKYCMVCGAPLERRVEKTVALPPGTVIAERYTIHKLLGHGGFGLTYLVEDTKLYAQRVLKELFPDGSKRDGTRVVLPRDLDAQRFQSIKERFLVEARTLARFQHPSIPTVFDVFDENSTAYFVMEFIEGPPLSRLIQEKGVLPDKEAVRITVNLLEVLKLLHGEGLLHMDIKPDNVLMPPNVNHVVLIDFGSVLEIGSDEPPRTYTPGYSPLEQSTAGMPLGPWTDLYAVGATLYEMLTGHVPPSAPDRMLGIELVPPRKLNPRIPEKLEEVVLWVLELEPENRPQSVDELIERLYDTGMNIASAAVQPASVAAPSRRERGSSALERIRAKREARKSARQKRASARKERASKSSRDPDGGRVTSKRRKPIPGTSGASPGGSSQHSPVKLIKRLRRERSLPLMSGVTPSGELLVAWTDHTLRLYDPREFTEQKVMDAHHKRIVTTYAASSAGWFATGCAEGHVRVWSTVSYKPRLLFKGHTSWVTTLGIHPDQRLLVSLDAAGGLLIWDVEGKKVVGKDKLEPHWFLLAEFVSPRTLVLFSATGSLYFYDLKHNKILEQLDIPGHFTTATFHRMRMTLLLGDTEGSLKFFNLHERKVVHELRAHPAAIRAIGTCVDHPSFLTLDQEGTLKIWENEKEEAYSAPMLIPEPLSLLVAQGGHVFATTQKGDLLLFTWERAKTGSV